MAHMMRFSSLDLHVPLGSECHFMDCLFCMADIWWVFFSLSDNWRSLNNWLNSFNYLLIQSCVLVLFLVFIQNALNISLGNNKNQRLKYSHCLVTTWKESHIDIFISKFNSLQQMITQISSNHFSKYQNDSQSTCAQYLQRNTRKLQREKC